jgi:hypothetical protein
MKRDAFEYDSQDDEFEIFAGYNPTGSPERRLLLGILERAILDYVGNDAREAEHAKSWIHSSDTMEDDFSFSWICAQLDLDPSNTAKYITSLPKRGSSRVAPWYSMKEKQENLVA